MKKFFDNATKEFIKKTNTRSYCTDRRYGIYSWNNDTNHEDYENLPKHDVDHVVVLNGKKEGVGALTSKEKNKKFPDMDIVEINKTERHNGTIGPQYMSYFKSKRSYLGEILGSDLKKRDDLDDYADRHQDAIDNGAKKFDIENRPTITITKKKNSKSNTNKSNTNDSNTNDSDTNN